MSRAAHRTYFTLNNNLYLFFPVFAARHRRPLGEPVGEQGGGAAVHGADRRILQGAAVRLLRSHHGAQVHPAAVCLQTHVLHNEVGEPLLWLNRTVTKQNKQHTLPNLNKPNLTFSYSSNMFCFIRIPGEPLLLFCAANQYIICVLRNTTELKVYSVIYTY